MLPDDGSRDERKAFYESILAKPWLPPKVRRAVKEALDRSEAAYSKLEFANALWTFVGAEKLVMKNNGERPRGGVHEAAVKEIAGEAGMTPATLKKHYQLAMRQAEKAIARRDGITVSEVRKRIRALRKMRNA
jgi:hypothetical protein